MEGKESKDHNENDNFNKTPVPLSKSTNALPSNRSVTQTVIVSLAETVTHDITFGMYKNYKQMCRIIRCVY